MKGILLAAALLAGQCGSTMAMTVKLSTDGGITGRGLGGITIDAPAIEASDNRQTCHGTLTTEEQRRFVALIEASHPETWRESYGEPAKPDQIHYVVTTGKYATSWYGENPSALPIDIKHLRDALWEARGRVLHDCR